ncbi:SymE family type I addiction module toxin [uncultured Apibacter sp.]|uniref:SymE family type I addiction module toxin n=1 Tax=uncultured Apibacter sp. TaxID=1778616 RepID=UPI0025DB4829|nr:SymE family type I addiction module toxin [uncultured Apibacter sp.]
MVKNQFVKLNFEQGRTSFAERKNQKYMEICKYKSKTKIRSIKIYERDFKRASFHYMSYPEIRMAGKWLQDSGFRTGDQVVIKHSKKRIVITKV